MTEAGNAVLEAFATGGQLASIVSQWDKLPQGDRSEILLYAVAKVSLLAGAAASGVVPAISNVASTDGPNTVTKAANTISALSARPTDDAGRISVNINGAGAVSLGFGQAFIIDSGNPAVKFSQSIVITVLSGTATFVSRS